MERAPRQLGVGLKVKGLWGEAVARRLMGMSVCRNGIFRGRRSARGVAHFVGEIVAASVFFWWG